MKFTKLTMLASLFLSLGLAACGETPAESSTPAKDSSAPISEKTPDQSSNPAPAESSSKEEPAISSKDNQDAPDADTEFAKMMAAYLKRDNYAEAYTVNQGMTFDSATSLLGDNTTENEIRNRVCSYNPGQAFYNSIKGADISDDSQGHYTYNDLDTSLYLKEDTGETLYEEYSYNMVHPTIGETSSDSKYKFTLSDGHVDHVGIFDTEYYADYFYLFNDESEYFTSFENDKDYYVSTLEYIAEELSTVRELSELFVMPEYEQDTVTSTIELGSEEDHSYALITSALAYSPKSPTTASDMKFAVSESTITMNFSQKMCYTEDSYLSTVLSVSYRIEGGDGTNVFDLSSSQTVTTSFAEGFDSENMPTVGETDDYAEGEMDPGTVSVYTPEGYPIIENYESDLGHILFREFTADLSDQGVAINGFYEDKEMTKENTNLSITTYDQTVYTEPHAAIDGQVFVIINYICRDDENSEYPIDTVGFDPIWKFFDIDENGQIDLSTYDSDFKNNVDSIELVMTNDSNQNIVDGKKMNVQHEKYYVINMYATLLQADR